MRIVVCLLIPLIIACCSFSTNLCLAKYLPFNHNHDLSNTTQEYRQIKSAITAKQQQLRCSSIHLHNNWLITINTIQQTLNVYSPQGRLLTSYRISTSKYGLGQNIGSRKTPIGLHQIVEKIGDGVPKYGIFKSRRFTKKIWPTNSKPGKDFIVTRILRLQGLEPGINRGKNHNQQVVDSLSRGIYIHGTTRESAIGTPATIGCVHLDNNNIIELFDLVPINTLVFIY